MLSRAFIVCSKLVALGQVKHFGQGLADKAFGAFVRPGDRRLGRHAFVVRFQARPRVERRFRNQLNLHEAAGDGDVGDAQRVVEFRQFIG